MRFRKARWRQEVGRKERTCRSGLGLLGISVLDASESNVRHATRVVAAAAGAEERVFVSLFLEIQKGTLESFVVAFGRLFRTKIGGV